MKNNLLKFLILLISFPFISYGQNCVSNTSLTTECIDAHNFTAFINFDHTLESSDLVSIVDLNGNDYGFFDPNQQPLVIEILLPNALMYEVGFTLSSMVDPNCAVETPTALVFCNDSQIEAKVLFTDCIEGSNNYLLGFEVVKNGLTPVSNYFIEHVVSGERYGPFENTGNNQGTTIVVELPHHKIGNFLVFDELKLDQKTISVNPDCISIPDCVISNITFETECINDLNLKAFIEFDYEGVSGDWVTIRDSNGKDHGQYKTDQQPIEVDVVFENVVDNQLMFTILSTQDSTCTASSESKTVSCYNCEIEAKAISAVCMPGNAIYRLTIEVKSIGASEIENFKIVHDATNQIIGLFNNYNSNESRLIGMTLPIQIQGDFTVSDANDLCVVGVNSQVDCSAPLCYISNVAFETECVDANNFTANIEFDYEAEMTQTVSVKDMNGNDYGLFHANQQPLHVDVVLQDTDSRDVGFVVTCLQNTDCMGESSLQTIACTTCDVEARTVSTECIFGSNVYQLTLEVINNGSSNIEDYKLSHTETGQFIGLFSNYAPDRPRMITVTLPTEIQGSFTVGDANGECETTTNAEVDCTNPFCHISNVAFETECVDANNFTANIEFDYDAEMTQTVSVKDMNGNDYGLFNATQQPLHVDVILQDTDSREVGFVITCLQDADCMGESSLQTIDCIDCELEAEVMHYECENNGETYHLALRIINYGDTDGAKYLVTHTATGRFIGAYSHFGSSQERFIDFYNPIDLQGEFTISLEGTNCATATNFEIECIPEDPCFLSNASLAYECLDQDQYQIMLNYEYAGIEGDTVHIADAKGNLLGLFDVSVQPVVLTIDNTNLTNNEFAVFIINPNDESCFVNSSVLAIACESTSPCEVETIEITSTDCNADGTYDLTANYSMSNDTENQVSVRVNGENLELHNNTGIINIEKIDARENSDYDTIEICSTNDSECCKIIEFLTPNCVPDGEECVLTITTVDYACEMTDYISFILAVDGNSTHDFLVKVNGVETGSGSLSQTLTEVGPILSNEDGSYLIEVVDVNSSDCNARFQLNQALCEPDPVRCSINNIDVGDLECTGDNEYEMTLNFEFDSEEDLQFSCMLNGVMMVTSTTSSLPLKMTGMISDEGNISDVLTICMDDLGSECCADFTYEKPNCLANSVKDNSLLDGVSISPNPASDVVYVRDIPEDIIGLTIVDNLGRIIQQIQDTTEVRLDVSNYEKGLYMIQFFTQDNRVMSKRFVKL